MYYIEHYNGENTSFMKLSKSKYFAKLKNEEVLIEVYKRH